MFITSGLLASNTSHGLLTLQPTHNRGYKMQYSPFFVNKTVYVASDWMNKAQVVGWIKTAKWRVQSIHIEGHGNFCFGEILPEQYFCSPQVMQKDTRRRRRDCVLSNPILFTQ